MFQIGDKVILKHPELSDWHDTMDGIASGNIKRNGVYVIKDIGEQKYINVLGILVMKLSVTLKADNYRSTWSLSPQCLELFKSKRNLPDWF
jgi:hypothetical protein